MERKRVSVWRVIGRHYLWIPLLPALFALIMGGVGLALWSEARVMARDGVEAVGQVTDRRIRTTSDRDGNRSTSYVVSYTFRPSSDQTVEASQAVSRALYDRLAAGDSVTVRYLPHDPGRSQLEAGGVLLPLILIAVALIAAAATLWLAQRMMGTKLAILRAARRGEVREARVTGTEATNVQVNGRTQYRLTWQDAAGQTGTSAMRDPIALPKAGTVVRVYVDPRTGRGFWEDDF